MKRAMLVVAVVALCVAGSALAEERTGLIGSGTRTEDSGQVVGSGNAAGQTVGSGGFTASSQNSQVMGSGGRSGDGSQTTADAGGLIGSGTRADGPEARVLRMLDGSTVLVVSSVQGTFIIPLEE